MKRAKPVVLAVVSDIHAGSSVALCPRTIALDDGGTYEASKAQRWLWQCWEDYWRTVSAKRKALGADLYVVFNGDAVDGDHHGTTQLVGQNPNVQAGIVTAAMGVVLACKPDRLYFVRGTEAHVGKSGSAEERIADGLRRDKRPIVPDPDTGTASHWHLKTEIQGVRLDITHHGRTGQRAHTRGGNAVLHAWDIFNEYNDRTARSKRTTLEYPHLCLRGHYHRWNDSGPACPVRVVTTGAWQLKTGYAHRKVADSRSDVAGALIVIQDGTYTLDKIIYEPAEPVWRNV